MTLPPHPLQNSIMIGMKAVRLETLDEQQRLLSRATGFFVKESDGTFLYTCWHVVTGIDFLRPTPKALPTRRRPTLAMLGREQHALARSIFTCKPSSGEVLSGNSSSWRVIAPLPLRPEQHSLDRVSWHDKAPSNRDDRQLPALGRLVSVPSRNAEDFSGLWDVEARPAGPFFIEDRPRSRAGNVLSFLCFLA
jgi:hypothetical protein